MSELRFRAWLKSEKRFVEIVHLNFDHKGNVTGVDYLIEHGVGDMRGLLKGEMRPYTQMQEVSLDEVILTQYRGG